MLVVTGGAGFIGSAVVWALNQQKMEDILIVDHLAQSNKWQNLRGLRYADYVEKDIFLKMVEGNALPEEVQAIIHLGACSDTTETNNRYLLENNYEYTKTLAKHCVDNDIRFIYASSAATYGDGSTGFSDDEESLEQYFPLNMYGYSKHMFDLWAKRNGLLSQIVGLKYTNVFGPNEYHKMGMRSMVKKAHEQIKADGKVRLFKSHRPTYRDGEQKRDFIYVKDAVKMTLHFLDKPQLNGIYNVSSGFAQSWNRLAQCVFKAMRRDVEITYVDMPEQLRAKYQYFTQSPIDKIRKAGYSEMITSLEDSILEYVTVYLEKDNPHLI